MQEQYCSIQELNGLCQKGWKNVARLDLIKANPEVGFAGRPYSGPISAAIDVIDEITQANLGPKESLIWALTGGRELRFCAAIVLMASPAHRSCFDSSESYEAAQHDAFGADRGRSKAGRSAIRSAVGRATSVLAASDNYEVALHDLADSKTVSALMRLIGGCPGHGRPATGKLRRLLSTPIKPMWQRAYGLVGDGLESRRAAEEMWWKCALIYMEPLIEQFLQIDHSIDEDIPLTAAQIDLLNHHMEVGSPRIILSSEAGQGVFQPKVLLGPNPLHAFILDDSFMYDCVANTLLMQPAYRLAEKLVECNKKPRRIVECRAPSCGRRFYTSRENQVTCSGSRGNKKSKCGLAWIAYHRWLVKLKCKPETDWANPELQQRFLSR